MTELPELGIGIIYFPGLEPVLEAGAELIQVIEIEPQQYWFRSDGGSYRLHDEAFARFGAFPQPKLVHGVGFPVGGTAQPDPESLSPFLAAVDALSSPWVSEHLSFNRARRGARDYNTGFLLPPLQSPEAVAIAGENIRRLMARLPVPFAFETGVNYLHPQSGEMSDGAFFAAVAEAAGCGILLDLHNLWANERNGRGDMLAVVEALPAERIWEIHLAGGQEFRGYWLDAHSDLMPAQLVDRVAEIVPRLPNLKAMIFEIMPEYVMAKDISPAAFRDMFQQMRELWRTRGRALRRRRPRRRDGVPAREAATLPSLAEWEDALGGLLVGDTADEGPLARLAGDDGVAVMRELVGTMRAGTVVSVLTLTCRLLMLSLGGRGFQELLQAFWKARTPETFAAFEAENFAEFLRGRALAVPHLYEVLAYETGVQHALVEGVTQTVRFSCDPLPLLAALGEGRLPDRTDPGRFDLAIDP